LLHAKNAWAMRIHPGNQNSLAKSRLSYNDK